MNQPLTKSAQSVQDVLCARGFDCRVIALPQSTRTAADAASTIGCDLGHIVKSLIFKTEKTHKPILILVSGPNRVDEKMIENYRRNKDDKNFLEDLLG